MITLRKAAGLMAVSAAALSLAGCVTLFPTTKPAQLYRFGEVPDAAPAGGGAQLVVLKGATGFDAAASGDRILTTTGSEAAYIADARWVSPASVLFDEAEIRAFSVEGSPVRLIARGQAAAAPYILRLDVQRFEVRYEPGKDTAPMVVVTVSAELTRLADRQIVASEIFDIHKPAAANRVGAIVEAFDGATAEVLGQIEAWTAKRGR
jgi:cholesterol transport system auxiliary component